jgi:hypothetical protein
MLEVAVAVYLFSATDVLQHFCQVAWKKSCLDLAAVPPPPPKYIEAVAVLQIEQQHSPLASITSKPKEITVT